MSVIGRDELRALAMLPETASGYSPFGEPCLLLGLSDAAERRLSEWLRRLPCPVIGIGRADAPLAADCDTVVDDERAAAPLLAGVRRNPIAASVFVQLLRATENLSVPHALAMESLAYATLQGGVEFRRWLEGRPAPQPPPREAGPAVLLSRTADGLHLTLNRPERRNSMSVEMRDALVEALELALADDAVRAVRIDGAGKCFSTGGELDEFGTAPDPATAHAVRSLTVPGRLLAACAERAEARVHGACIGSGIEFPAFAGRVIAAPDAWFQLPELQFGLIPGAGGCVSIPRRIGRQRAAWMVLGGKRIDAATARDWGLVDAVGP